MFTREIQGEDGVVTGGGNIGQRECPIFTPELATLDLGYVFQSKVQTDQSGRLGRWCTTSCGAQTQGVAYSQ